MEDLKPSDDNTLRTSEKDTRYRRREVHPLRDNLELLMRALNLVRRGRLSRLAEGLDITPQTLNFWKLGSAPSPADMLEHVQHLARIYPAIDDVEATARWLPSATEPRPAWMARPVDPSDIEDPTRSETQMSSAATPPAHPGGAEKIFENGIAKALEVLPRGPETDRVRRILEGTMRVVNEARKLGLATIVSFAMIAAGSTPAQAEVAELADALDSGWASPNRRRNRLAAKHRVSAFRRAGWIIRLDDARRRLEQPTSTLRSNPSVA